MNRATAATASLARPRLADGEDGALKMLTKGLPTLTHRAVTSSENTGPVRSPQRFSRSVSREKRSSARSFSLNSLKLSSPNIW